MQTENTPVYLKKAEVCAQLGISARTLENLVLANKFPKGVPMGKWAFWSPKVLQDWRQRQFAVQEAWRPV
ncbi:MAG: DNA-binding protein [Rhodoferax sp.]|uniref:helix-turn-helix transcriptional regulator n=1 Tax=Rhodoferax sp. TaxID=50421 RepID=UPI002715713F|nr:DNA-binding protein [Rhodoferax sp.]MDO8450360.1 DNA-binding protein [Rhodoferax sp.]